MMEETSTPVVLTKVRVPREKHYETRRILEKLKEQVLNDLQPSWKDQNAVSRAAVVSLIEDMLDGLAK